VSDTDETAASDQAMTTVTSSITVQTLAAMAQRRFGSLVKAVVDIGRGIMVVDAEMHADEEALLLDGGSLQADLWASTWTQIASVPRTSSSSIR
jgi:hypothetical protein